jgi:hypothetical protein
MNERQKARLRALAWFIVSVAITLGLAQLYVNYSRWASDAEWYFLAPPDLFGEHQPDANAPLWQWELRESYGSRRLCEAARKRELADVAKESGSWQARVALERCVAANARGVPHSDYWWKAHPEHLIDRNPPPNSALSRWFNHIAADSRTNPGVSLADRLVELWLPVLFIAGIAYALISALGISRIGIVSKEFETSEINQIAVRIARDELTANGWDLGSEEGRKMLYAGMMAHIVDAAYEYDCRWDVRFTRWIRGLPPQKRFASVVSTLREIRSEAPLRREESLNFADLLVSLECAALQLVLALWMFAVFMEFASRADTYLTARGLGFLAWVGFPIIVGIVLFRFAPPFGRRLDWFLAQLQELLPSSPVLTRAMHWWSAIALAAATITFALEDPGDSYLPNLSWLWLLAALAVPLWPISQVVQRRLNLEKKPTAG